MPLTVSARTGIRGLGGALLGVRMERPNPGDGSPGRNHLEQAKMPRGSQPQVEMCPPKEGPTGNPGDGLCQNKSPGFCFENNLSAKLPAWAQSSFLALAPAAASRTASAPHKSGPSDARGPGPSLAGGEVPWPLNNQPKYGEHQPRQQTSELSNGHGEKVPPDKRKQILNRPAPERLGGTSQRAMMQSSWIKLPGKLWAGAQCQQVRTC